MTIEEVIAMLTKGKDAWNDWRTKNSRIVPALSRIDFTTQLVKERLINNTPYQQDHYAKGWDFSRCDFTESVLAGINFRDCDFTGTNLTDADLSNSTFLNCRFGESGDSMIGNYEPYAAKMSRAILLGTKFERCILNGMNFCTSVCDEKTSFLQVSVLQACISRRILDELKDNGGLTDGQMRRMTVHDDLAKLRSLFSGYRRTFYWLLAVAFVLPYAWFVCVQWTVARVGEQSDPRVLTSPLIVNLIRFIWSGGGTWREWRFEYKPFLLFMFAVAYHAIRIALLLKTSSLEHFRAVNGYSPDFEIDGVWKWLFCTYQVLSIFAVGVIIMHCLWFLLMPVPI